jgi:16S rRNA (cytidine1402-2'-O)-methyltransferase
MSIELKSKDPSEPKASKPNGILYLIPVPLVQADQVSNEDLQNALPVSVLALLERLDYLIAERAKTARAFLKHLLLNKPIQEIEIQQFDQAALDKSLGAKSNGQQFAQRQQQLDQLLEPLLHGRDAGLLSESGCPAIADPGADLVRRAHERGIVVTPLVGPSSILLALMGGGLSGQQFAFLGYLPATEPERIIKLKACENRSRADKEALVWIETPYRCKAMLSSCLQTLSPSTLLSLAIDIGYPKQAFITRSVAQWRKTALPDLQGKLVVFSLLAN